MNVQSITYTAKSILLTKVIFKKSWLSTGLSKIKRVFHLTPTLAEWRIYDIGHPSGYCAKFYIRELFQSKCSYPFWRLLQILYFADFARKTVRPRKKLFLTGRFVNFAQISNSSGCKNLKWRWNYLKTLCKVEEALENI